MSPWVLSPALKINRNKNIEIKIKKLERWFNEVRALAAPTEDPSSIPSTMTGRSLLPTTPGGGCHAYIHIIKKNSRHVSTHH